MRIGSFFEENSQLKPLEIEMALWPGLPNIHFVGRADPQLKESALRIKSAIKAAGFRFPVTQQILVNLSPTHIKKTSRGLELAVALLYLWKTQQLSAFPKEQFDWVYGELGLDGRAIAPGDLDKLRLPATARVLTGGGSFSSRIFSQASVPHLKSTDELTWLHAEDASRPLDRPSMPLNSFYSKEEARLLEILGSGGHHALLAGAAGCGKTTLARTVYHLLPDINLEDFQSENLQSASPWRPLIEPHHSTPRMAMIGGGNPPRPGEVARAHQGVLFLDEFLEFQPYVLESLREPFERGELRVSRLGGIEVYPAKAQIIGATNLCPCGDFVPGKVRSSRCRYTLKRCQSYSERISGPLLDRFQILYFPKVGNKDRAVSLDEIRGRVLKTHEWQKAQRKYCLTRFMDPREISESLSTEVKLLGFSAQNLSERRRNAVVRVARTIADLEASPVINMKHVNEAVPLALESFQRLNRWQFEEGC